MASDGLRSMEASHLDALARECQAYCKHLNQILGQYQEELQPAESTKTYLPLTPENLLERLRDGVVLGYLLHHYYPGLIRVGTLARNLDLSRINQPHSKAIF